MILKDTLHDVIVENFAVCQNNLPYDCQKHCYAYVNYLDLEYYVPLKKTVVFLVELVLLTILNGTSCPSITL